MRRLLVAGLAAGLLATTAPAAVAHPTYHYEGGCELAVAVQDTTPGGQLGGRDVWTGVMSLAAVATDAAAVRFPQPTVPIDVRCWMRINGVDIGLSVFGAGAGFAFDLAHVTYLADPDRDWVEVCEDVWVNGEFHRACEPVVYTSVVPEPVLDLVQVLTDPILYQTDPLICPLLAVVRGLPPTLYVDPDGDVYLFGDLVYDCPPYALGQRPWRRLVGHVATTLLWI